MPASSQPPLLDPGFRRGDELPPDPLVVFRQARTACSARLGRRWDCPCRHVFSVPIQQPMRTKLLVPCLVTLSCLSAASAAAQSRYVPYSAAAARATGETYHAEFSVHYWSAAPSLVFTVQSIDIPGSTIDGVRDLGFETERPRNLQFVVRPAKKHKFSFSYVPIKYTGDTVLEREIVFDDVAYQVGVPVQSVLQFRSRRIGYEYDFLYRNRWFVGVLVGADLAEVSASIEAPLIHGSIVEKTPTPLLGGTVRVYPVKNVSLTAKIQGFRLPESVDSERRYSLRILDVDLYATLNFTDNFGAQAGYRSFDVTYRVKEDSGDFLVKGYYIGGVVRF
jgi:hypothetical protein